MSSGAALPAPLRPRPVPGRALTVALLVYGVAVALVVGGVLARTSLVHVKLMSDRTLILQQTTQVFRSGGPPLLACAKPYQGPAFDLQRDCRPAGVTDDQGIYLYLPLLGAVIGSSDPLLLLKWLFILLFVPLLAGYPLLFRRISGSTTAGVVAPLLVCWFFSFFRFLDIYWVTAWCLLATLPVLALLLRRERLGPSGVAVLMAICIVGGVATSIRNHAGLPILVAALGVAIVRLRGHRRMALIIALLALNFVPSTGALTLARHLRDSETGVALGSGEATTHPFWHPAYLGLGYLPNHYAITWDDSVAAAAVERERPGTRYLSPAYESTLKTLYWRIVEHDPWLVARTYIVKAWVTIADSWRDFGLSLLVLPVALLGARRNRRDALLVVPALALGFIPPVMAMPYREYEIGWLGALAVLVLFCATWTVARAASVCSKLAADRGVAPPRQVAGEIAARLQATDWPRARRATALGALVGLAAILVVVANRTGGGEMQILGRAQSSPLAAPLPAKSLLDWSFAGAVPDGWAVQQRVRVASSPSQVIFQVPRDTSPYIVTGPQVEVRAGWYRLELDGEVLKGGLEVRVGTGAPPEQQPIVRLWNGVAAPGKRPGVDFKLAADGSVQLLLVAWSPELAWSPWLPATDVALRSIRVVPL